MRGGTVWGFLFVIWILILIAEYNGTDIIIVHVMNCLVVSFIYFFREVT